MVMQLNDIRAFTLAEVLITLGIIGVVAAITIPTLMANYQKAQYVTALKKAYSQINQVLVKIADDHGCPGDLAGTGLFATGGTHKLIGDELVKYLSVVKNCGDAGDGGTSGCFTDNHAENYDGQIPNSGLDSSYYRFITADGMTFRLNSNMNDCALDWSNNITNNMTQMCGSIMIDVNGLKGPNYMGRDIFNFYITNGKGPMLYPRGGTDDGTGDGSWAEPDGTINTCDSVDPDGWLCTGRVIEEGWHMNY